VIGSGSTAVTLGCRRWPRRLRTSHAAPLSPTYVGGLVGGGGRPKTPNLSASPNKPARCRLSAWPMPYHILIALGANVLFGHM